MKIKNSMTFIIDLCPCASVYVVDFTCSRERHMTFKVHMGCRLKVGYVLTLYVTKSNDQSQLNAGTFLNMKLRVSSINLFPSENKENGVERNICQKRLLEK